MDSFETIHTPLIDIIENLKFPIIQGGMGPYGTNNLAAAVAKAGALGLISTVGMASSENFDMTKDLNVEPIFGPPPTEARLIRSIDYVLDKLKNVNDCVFGLNIPVSEEFVKTADIILKTAYEYIENNDEARKKLKVIITSAGNPYQKFVMDWIKKIGVKWGHVVPSVRHALKAEQAGVDFIIASGREGGAHISWLDAHSMVLIPAVADAVKKPVVAAGGFCDGRSFMAAIALGAVGIQMGTRFIATQESDFQLVWKKSIIPKRETDTLVGRGFFGPMRFIRNQTAEKMVKLALNNIPEMYMGKPLFPTQDMIDLEMQSFNALHYASEDEEENVLILGGEVIGRIKDLPTVSELIKRIMKEAKECLENLKVLKFHEIK
ncbi:MAG: NAD(P)H-dependent flavin oxidoreductase [Promethearchaeia archaeon]